MQFNPDADNPLWDLVNQVYSIEQDSARLREGMALAASERALLFDQLRKNYPKRREFSHYKIKQASISDTDRDMLVRLGFNLI